MVLNSKRWEVATLHDLDIFMALFEGWNGKSFSFKGDRRYFKCYFKGNKRQRKKALKKVVSNVFYSVIMPYAKKVVSEAS